MLKLAEYPSINDSFSSNGNIWTVTTVVESNARIFLECRKPDDTDTIELDYAAYAFLLKFGFMHKLKKEEGQEKLMKQLP